MSFFGSYFGTAPAAAAAVIPTPPDPIPAPVSPGDAEYLDHIEAALNRLCEYAKAKKP